MSRESMLKYKRLGRTSKGELEDEVPVILIPEPSRAKRKFYLRF